jgi:hypothetical protein
MSIVHAEQPQQSSGTFNVNSVAPGQRAPVGLTLVGNRSYGDWTLYMVREIQGEGPGIVSNTVRARVQVGHGQVGVDAQIMPNLFLSAQSLQTWQVYHVVGSEIRLDIDVDATIVPGFPRPASDRVNAWIAPGRPSLQYVRHQLIVGTAALIPRFAVALHCVGMATDVAWLEWLDAAGTVISTTQVTDSASAVSVDVVIPVPSSAVRVRPTTTITRSAFTHVMWHVFA